MQNEIYLQQQEKRLMWLLVKHRERFRCLFYISPKLLMKINFSSSSPRFMKIHCISEENCMCGENKFAMCKFMASFEFMLCSWNRGESCTDFHPRTSYANALAHYGSQIHFCNSLIHVQSLNFIGSERVSKESSTKRAKRDDENDSAANNTQLALLWNNKIP